MLFLAIKLVETNKTAIIERMLYEMDSVIDATDNGRFNAVFRWKNNSFHGQNAQI